MRRKRGHPNPSRTRGVRRGTACVPRNNPAPPRTIAADARSAFPHRHISAPVREAMNRIYSIVWSTSTSAWVVASELATGERERDRRRAHCCAVRCWRRPSASWGLRRHCGAEPVLGRRRYGLPTRTAARARRTTPWPTGIPPRPPARTRFGATRCPTPGVRRRRPGDDRRGGVTARGLTFIGGGYTFNGASLRFRVVAA